MDRIVPAQKAIEIKHTKAEGGLIINVGTTEQIEEMAKVTKPKRLKTKGDDEVIAEVLDGDS
jgi:S-adenosylmethionine:tRNA-ribosyltransferase-isomerase (queuine synthetase)